MIHPRHLLVALIAASALAPSARAAISEFAEPFKATWGDKVKAAAATPGGKDDLQLATEILDAARKNGVAPGLAGYMCEQAYTLAGKDPTGLSTAIDAMSYRGAILPETRADCADKALAMGQRQFISARPADKAVAGDRLIDILIAQADLWSDSGEYEKAAVALKRASTTAAGLKSERAAQITAQSQLLQHRQKISLVLAPHLAKLKTNAQDKEAAHAAMRYYTVDFDNPAKAAGYADAAGDAEWTKSLHIVLSPDKELKDTDALAVGEWYRGLSAKAAPPVAGSMLQRSYHYYLQFIIRHPPTDPQRMKIEDLTAKLEESMHKLNVEVPESPLVASDSKPHRRASFFGIEVK